MQGGRTPTPSILKLFLEREKTAQNKKSRGKRETRGKGTRRLLNEPRPAPLKLREGGKGQSTKVIGD